MVTGMTSGSGPVSRTSSGVRMVVSVILGPQLTDRDGWGSVSG